MRSHVCDQFIKKVYKIFVFYEEATKVQGLEISVKKKLDEMLKRMITKLHSELVRNHPVVDEEFLNGKKAEELEDMHNFVKLTFKLIYGVCQILEIGTYYVLPLIKIDYMNPVKVSLERATFLNDCPQLLQRKIPRYLSNCPYTVCPVCMEANIDEDTDFVKFDVCRHLFCKACVYGIRKSTKDHKKM